MTYNSQFSSITPVSPLERLLRKASRIRIPSLLACILIATALTITAGTIAIHVSREYYAVAPYHYDSATYRSQAVDLYHLIETEGRVSALRESLQTKDSLDLTLRILLAPHYLIDLYGHLVVGLPFMGLFLSLTIWYTFSRTRSIWMATAIISVLFMFPLIYSPIRGIADFWKDSLAAWLWGSAIVAWLLADNLKRYRWFLLCSLCLGALAVQRSSVAVYAALLFAPLFIWAVIQRIRSDGVWQALKRILAFIAPVAIIGGIVLVVQWQQLYYYYTAFGYAYGDPVSVATFLVNEAKSPEMVPFLLTLIGLCLLCLLSIATWRQQLSEIVVAAWFAVAFPIIISLSSAFYHSFSVVWAVLLTILLATLAPRTLQLAHQRWVATVVLVVALSASIFQFQASSKKAQQIAAYSAPQRALFEELATIISAQPEPRNYALLFDEIGNPFWNQVFFDHGMRLNPPMLFISVHDSYYRALFGNQSAEQIVNSYVALLEQQSGGIVVGYCTPDGVSKNPLFEGNPVAKQISSMMSDYVLNDPHWAAISKITGPYGCLYVYKHSTGSLTAQEKWGNLAFSNTLDELPLPLPVGPSVKIYNYTSRYPPEHYNGGYYQWLPAGPEGLQLTLFSDQPRRVVFQAQTMVGPAREDPQRTLVMSNGSQKVSTLIEDSQPIQLDIDLKAGLNHINFFVEESPDDRPPAGADSRELMLLLISPRLVPVAN